MAISKTISKRASKIIAVSAIGVLIVAGLTLSFLAQEPAGNSLVIKLTTEDDNEPVLQGGSVSERTARYTINVENKDQGTGRNVTLKYNWTNPTNAEDLGWGISFNPESVEIGANDIDQVEVTIIAPIGAVKDTGSIVKIFAWEYRDIYPSPPPLTEQNSTKDVSGGEVLLFTDVVEAAKPVPPGPGPGNPARETGFIGDVISFYGEFQNNGYTDQYFTLSAVVNTGTRAEVWQNSVEFDPERSDFLKYGQRQNFRMDVRPPLDADSGTYFIDVTATGSVGGESSFTYTLDVPAPDLYIDEISFSHDSILVDNEITIYVEVGNRGSKITDKFAVEVSAQAPEGGAWDVVGIENITNLNYGDTKSVSFTYTIPEEGLWTFQARVDSLNKIEETDNSNNIAKEDIEATTTEVVETSFYTHIIILVASVCTVSALSIKAKKWKKK
jgi:hypothetical protein